MIESQFCSVFAAAKKRKSMRKTSHKNVVDLLIFRVSALQKSAIHKRLIERSYGQTMGIQT